MAVQMGEDNEMSMGAGGVVEKRNNNKHNKNNENCDDLMFEIELWHYESFFTLNLSAYYR